MAEPVEMNVSQVLDKDFDLTRIRRVEIDLTSVHGNHPSLAFVLENIFSAEECKKLIALSELAGYTTALIHDGDEAVAAPGYRDGDRVMIDDKEFVRILESRIQSFLPQKFENRRFLEINERLRFLRYSAGGQFKPHCDASYVRPDYTARTLITLQIYLNEGFDGGETTFMDYDEVMRVPVIPKTGMILVFEHDLYHEGSLVRSGFKYTIRTDVLYNFLSRPL
ncbi:probable prolyl 4-hydroxylase 3 [Bradysia coprophila]|uniref:probable prolyl 4-hydroxylase 3 n=1 Tax=Bradysia coprophila TaxID=38358 RepID=UPI00187DBF9B|nr:probable prolyl 4-hydroxylase 3 [Bradysia coprophila]